MLDRISNENPDVPDEQRIRHARKPLKGLSDRVFRRLLTLHIRIGRDEIVDRLLTEITRNSDYRLGLKLIQFARHFPRKLSIQNRLMKLLRNGEIVFPSQEAQLIKALRYQSRVQPDTLKYMLERASDDLTDPQIRVQAFQLLSRSKLSQEMVQAARVAFDDAEHTAVKMAATFVLIRQRGQRNSQFIRQIVFHPNDDLRRLGRFLRAAKNDKVMANQLVGQAFKGEFLLVDYIPLLYLLVESRERDIIEIVLNAISASGLDRTCKTMDMRDRLVELGNSGRQNLERLPISVEAQSQTTVSD